VAQIKEDLVMETRTTEEMKTLTLEEMKQISGGSDLNAFAFFLGVTGLRLIGAVLQGEPFPHLPV
jgi:bacteriocin-like protein